MLNNGKRNRRKSKWENKRVAIWVLNLRNFLWWSKRTVIKNNISKCKNYSTRLIYERGIRHKSKDKIRVTERKGTKTTSVRLSLRRQKCCVWTLRVFNIEMETKRWEWFNVKECMSSNMRGWVYIINRAGKVQTKQRCAEIKIKVTKIIKREKIDVNLQLKTTESYTRLIIRYCWWTYLRLTRRHYVHQNSKLLVWIF